MSRSFVLIAIAILVSSTSAQISYDASFWEGFENSKPYEHEWLTVPDMIHNETVYWWFNQTHHFLTGV
jgi:hypothetical protein